MEDRVKSLTSFIAGCTRIELDAARLTNLMSNPRNAHAALMDGNPYRSPETEPTPVRKRTRASRELLQLGAVTTIAFLFAIVGWAVLGINRRLLFVGFMLLLAVGVFGWERMTQRQ